MASLSAASGIRSGGKAGLSAADPNAPPCCYLNICRNPGAKNMSGQIEINVATQCLAARRDAPIKAASFQGNKVPLKSYTLPFQSGRGGDCQEALASGASALTDRKRCTHHGNLGGAAHDVAPGLAKDVRQVEDEVDEAAARRRQVGFGEEDANEEALSDSGQAEDQQEDEDERGVAVLEDAAVLVAQEDTELPSDQASEDAHSCD